MLPLRYVVPLVVVSLTILGADTASCQNYPNKPIRIVTSGVGGGNDFTARLIAQGLTVSMGQQLVVENRGSGVIPGQVVSQAPPDGYTLLVAGGNFTIGPLLEKTPYDPVRDFFPISLVTSAPNILVVHPSLPVKSVKELIALAKARPRELNYASAGAGGTIHLAAELFKAMASVNIVRIPYKSSATQMADLIGGHVQLTFGNAANVNPHVKSGRLRALAVASAQPSALAPDLPTVAASGLPGYESVQMSGIFAPAKTPGAIINRLNQEVVRFLRTADAKERFLNSGVETVGSSPEELAATMKSEITRLGKVIKDAGIRAD